MPVTIKSAREIERMRVAGKILASVHEELGKALKPGMSTLDIDRLGEELIRSHGCVPSFKNYNGYPASICVSVNDEIVHGIPNSHRIIHEGDIVSLDAGVIYEGYHSDAARTHAVGVIDPKAQKLIDVTRESFFEGIRQAKAGNYLNDISSAIQAYAESFGYGVVRDLVGHGIGSHLHESGSTELCTQKERYPPSGGNDTGGRTHDQCRNLAGIMDE
jgi:methionyl aminopeptidase